MLLQIFNWRSREASEAAGYSCAEFWACTGQVSESRTLFLHYTPNAVVELLPQLRQYFCQDHGIRSVLLHMHDMNSFGKLNRLQKLDRQLETMVPTVVYHWPWQSENE